MVVWEIHAGDVVEIACTKCAFEYLVEHKVPGAKLGVDHSDDQMSVTEDVFGQHGECKHRCFECGQWLASEPEPEQTPCDKCGTLIATDIHKEELGMCVECSNAYFSHDDEKE